MRWRSKVGAWVGLGASPGSLLLGAGLAERHGGAVPAITIVLGVAAIAAFLWFQGSLGVQPPVGEGGTLSVVSRAYFGPRMQRILGGVLALAMVGWFGFNVGLGGAAISALLGLPQAVGPVLVGAFCLVLALGGLRRWNVAATAATVAALLLMVLVVAQLAARVSPVSVGVDDPGLIFADLGIFVGFVSVFGTRAPDFSAGLASRRELAWCVAMLCVPFLIFSLAGVGLQIGTGTSDLIGVLSGSGALGIGNLLLAAAVVGPTITTQFSGSLALESLSGLRVRRGMVAVTVLGLVLAVARFDRQFIGWLTLLAAILPSLMVAMAFESVCRRRGARPRMVPLWSWLPGSLVALVLMLTGLAAAPLVGLLVSGLTSAVWRRRTS